MENDGRLIKIIKEQAQTFLLHAGEFFPFGTCITNENKILPIGSKLEAENDRPSSLDVIHSLEKEMKLRFKNGTCSVFAIVVDITLTQKGVPYNAVEIRFYEVNKSYTRFYKYYLRGIYVEFVLVE